MVKFQVIIPARFASTRLPGKVLAPIGGKPMIQRVYENASASGAESVWIATEDKQVKEAAEAFGAKVCMTSASHQSGTERIAEVCEQLNFPADAIVVNLQGDEPFMPSENIKLVAADLAKFPEASVSTVCERIHSIDDVFNPNVVKVVMDKDGYALYFSRAPIAWDRAHFDNEPRSLASPIEHFRHLGIYAYRAGFLPTFLNWPGSYLEKVESLEQLKVLWNGGKIHLALSDLPSGISIDTHADLVAAEKYL